MSETTTRARNVLCVLHDEPDRIRKICAEFSGFEYDIEYSGRGRDTRMADAFLASSDTAYPSLGDSDRVAIAEHKNVTYILAPPLYRPSALGEARRALEFVRCCFENGARAVKCESSGLSHGKGRWLELAGQEGATVLYSAWVRRPLVDSGTTYSCGMHLLGYPDVEVFGIGATDAFDLIEGFAMYLLIDRPGDLIATGHTFSPAADAPRYRIMASPCVRYEEDDFFYNPHGYWSLESAKG